MDKWGAWAGVLSYQQSDSPPVTLGIGVESPQCHFVWRCIDLAQSEPVRKKCFHQTQPSISYKAPESGENSGFSAFFLNLVRRANKQLFGSVSGSCISVFLMSSDDCLYNISVINEHNGICLC